MSRMLRFESAIVTRVGFTRTITGGHMNKLFWYDLGRLFGPAIRYVKYLRWQVRIRLVRFGARCHERAVRFHVQTHWKDESESRFARFVDKVSPWITNTGYKRGWLRRSLYKMRYPLWFARRFTFETLDHRFYAPRWGRFEGFVDPANALKAEWLDAHIEYANYTTGDTDTYLWAALFRLLDVPWSRETETWLLTIDSRGFVDAWSGENAAIDFLAMDAAYTAYVEADNDTDDREDDRIPDEWENREGWPEFNGAFR